MNRNEAIEAILGTSGPCLRETTSATTLFHSRYLPDIHDVLVRERVTVIDSALGTGKSTQIVSALGRIGPVSILAISSRVLFAYSFTECLSKRFPEMAVYCDIPATERSSHRFFTCQVESLCTIDGSIKFDVVLVDESESVLCQLTSTTNARHFSANVRNFDRLLRNAKKVIWADAFLTDRTLRAAHSLNAGNKTHLVRNTYVPLRRTREMLGHNHGALVKHITTELTSKRTVVVSGNKQAVYDLQAKLPSGTCWAILGAPENEDEESRLERQRLLRNPNTTAAAFQHLCYTSALSVGTDITVAYDVLGLYCSPNGPIPRDLFQALYRVRNITENRLVYSVYPRYHGERKPVYDLEQLRAETSDRLREQGYNFAGSLTTSSGVWDLPEWMRETAAFNELEANVSTHEFLEVLERFFTKCGYADATRRRWGGGKKKLASTTFKTIPTFFSNSMFQEEGWKRRRVKLVV